METIVPSIYNSTPAPDIRPRHNGKDDIAKSVADVLERAIASMIDDNRLDAEIEAEAQDGFMAGRGVVRLRFDSDEVPIEEVVGIDPTTGEPVVIQEASVQHTNQRILYENVSWRDYREGPAKRWSDVPWVAFRHSLSEGERRRLEDDDIAGQYAGDDEADNEELDVDVWEIWCKTSKQVYFVTESTSRVLSIGDDPLGLTGFFPNPQPVQPITGTGKRTPVCPYKIYKAQAEELNRLTRRITAITEGLKAKGAVASDAGDIENWATADDNTITTIANIENIAAAGGLERAIAWWPIDKCVAVLRELQAQRDQVKMVIYEITGISDIIRGQGAASETATAQQIKTQWGSLRIKKMQNLIQRQVRDLFVMTAEIIGNLFPLEAVQQASGMQVSPEMMALLSSPGMHYRIDVESDSTIRADLTKNRGEMWESQLSLRAQRRSSRQWHLSLRRHRKRLAP